MNYLFVCDWETADIAFDKDDGEDYIQYSCVTYTTHNSLQEAEDIADQNYIGYGLATGKITDINNEDYYERVHCGTILMYENNILIGKYIKMDHDGWRHYEFRNHWTEYWPHLINYPPAIPTQ